MIASDLPNAIVRLRRLIENASVILPFTGAGISTECGIPDFRSPGGIWTKNQPIPFEAFVSSQEMWDEAWRRRFFQVAIAQAIQVLVCVRLAMCEDLCAT